MMVYSPTFAMLVITGYLLGCSGNVERDVEPKSSGGASGSTSASGASGSTSASGGSIQVAGAFGGGNPDLTRVAPLRPIPESSRNPKTPSDCQYEFHFVCDDMNTLTGNCYCTGRDVMSANACREHEAAKNERIGDPELFLVCFPKCDRKNCYCFCLNKP